MQLGTRIPIRLKIMISLLFGITLVVSVLVFTMASFFHDDKRSYMRDWISIAAVNTAAECRYLLEGYTQRLRLAASIAADDAIGADERDKLVRRVFEDLPQLVDLEVRRDGETLQAATDRETLEAAGLTREELRAPATAPGPESLVPGLVHLRNTTVSPELPCFTLSFADAGGDGRAPVLVSAVLRLDELLRLGAQFKVFEVAIVDADGVLLTHPDVARVARRERAQVVEGFERVHDRSQAGFTSEYTLGETEMIGGYAAVDFAGMTVAAQIPKASANLASRALIGRLMLVAFVVMTLVAVGGRFWSRRITRPVERLSAATRQIARGEFHVQVDVDSGDEIGTLARSFNQMATELDARETQLGEAHAQLIQSEKLAAFGQLGAGIAHEVKNPLAGILGCAQLSLMEVEDGTLLQKNLQLIEKETERCKTIIENLLKFARQEKSMLEPTEVNPVVDDAVAIVNHQLELQNVKIRKRLDPHLPLIWGNGNQLQQVLINLMVNAQQAMEGEPGNVTVITRTVGPRVEIVVEDDGPGIPKEIQPRLFDPFFTTKPTGKGTGLGLSVSFGIVKDHRGEIRIESEPGQGARFTIGLPALEELPAGVRPEEIDAAEVRG